MKKHAIKIIIWVGIAYLINFNPFITNVQLRVVMIEMITFVPSGKSRFVVNPL